MSRAIYAPNRPNITYFDIRGRAEPIRLILEEVGVEYEERRIRSMDEWQALKPKKPFGQLPIYEEGDLFIVQSHAIFRHLARVHNLYGRNEDEHVACDIVEESICEANESLWRFFWDKDFERKRAEFATGELTRSLQNLLAWFERKGDNLQFWAGNSLTFADFLAFTYFDELRAFFPETLAKFSRLRDFRERIASRPRIAAYLRSERHPIGFGYGVHGRKDDPSP